MTLEPDVYQRIEEQARARGIAPETLVNVWLVERLQQATRSDPASGVKVFFKDPGNKIGSARFLP